MFGKLGLGNKDQHFTLHDMLEPGLPEKPLQAPQDLKNFDIVMGKLKRTKADASTLCFHMGSTEARLEWNVGASTCVRPSHDIFCNLVKRPLKGAELLRLQGSWARDYPHPEAVEELDNAMAKDLAGNAFPTTVLQANLLSSMISFQSWKEAGMELALSPSPYPPKKQKHIADNDKDKS